MGTTHFGKKRMTLVSCALAVSTGLMGCGSYGAASNSAATAVITADKPSIILGESIVLDASSSTFDTLQWFANGTAQTGCVDQSACVITPEQVGSYEIAIQSKVSGNAQAAQASVIIQVEGASTSASSNPGRNQDSTMPLGSTPAAAAVNLGDTNGTLTISNGSLALTNFNSDSLTLDWNKSVDTVAAGSALQYLAYYSTSNNLDTVAAIEANGTAIGVYTADIATKAVTGLTPETTYYFNIIAKNPNGDKVHYIVSSWKMGKAITFDTGNMTYVVSGITQGTITGSLANSNKQVTLMPTGYYSSAAAALYKTDVPMPYAVEFEYQTGTSANADGISFIFAKDRSNYGTILSGGALGFSHDTKGYAVRLEIAGHPRIELVDGSNTILASYADPSVATNSSWNKVKVEVSSSSIKIFYLGKLVINKTMTVNGTYASIGFGSATGTGTGSHLLRNAVLYSSIPAPQSSLLVVNRGALYPSNMTTSGVTLNWTSAADSGSSNETLFYRVYYSTSNNLTTLANVETNGTAAGDFVAASTNKAVTGLTGGSTYYFNVVAKNNNGFKQIYTSRALTIPSALAGPKDLANYQIFAGYGNLFAPSFGWDTYRAVDVAETISNDNYSVNLTPTGFDSLGVAMLYNQTVKVPFTITFDYTGGGDGMSFMFGKDFADYQTKAPGGGGWVGMIPNASSGDDVTKRYTVKYNVYANPDSIDIFNSINTVAALATGTCVTTSGCTGSWLQGKVVVTATQIQAYTANSLRSTASHAYASGQDVSIGFGAGTGAATGINQVRNVVFTQN